MFNYVSDLVKREMVVVWVCFVYESVIGMLKRRGYVDIEFGYVWKV